MKRKITYSLSALLLAMILSISGIGNCYIKAEASSGVLDPLWNTEASAWSNIGQYLQVFAAAAGLYAAPNAQTAIWGAGAAASFLNFMLSDGYSQGVAHEVVHGGGGFVRDGITRDSDGNITYSDEVSDLFYNYLLKYIYTDTGYLIFESMTVDDIPAEFWGENSDYLKIKRNLKTSVDLLDQVFASIDLASKRIFLYYCPNDAFWSTEVSKGTFTFDMPVNMASESSGDPKLYHMRTDSLHDGNFYDHLLTSYYNYQQWAGLGSNGVVGNIYYPVSDSKMYIFLTDDGRLCRIYPSYQAYLNRNNTNQSYYYSSDFNYYNSNDDNSITLTSAEYQYYTDNSSTVYNNVQNIVNNSGSDLTEDDIQRIVEDELKKFKDNMKEEEKEDDNTVPDDDSGNDSGGGGSVSGNGTGGTGIGDFVGGLGSLLDFILSLLGKVIGLISDFLNSALELLGNLTSFTDGFSSFLTAAFGFLPEEAVTMICSGIALLITLGIIKYMRN